MKVSPNKPGQWDKTRERPSFGIRVTYHRVVFYMNCSVPPGRVKPL